MDNIGRSLPPADGGANDKSKQLSNKDLKTNETSLPDAESIKEGEAHPQYTVSRSDFPPTNPDNAIPGFTVSILSEQSESEAASAPIFESYAGSENEAASEPVFESYGGSENEAASEPVFESYGGSENEAASEPVFESYAGSEKEVASAPVFESYGGSENEAEGVSEKQTGEVKEQTGEVEGQTEEGAWGVEEQTDEGAWVTEKQITGHALSDISSRVSNINTKKLMNNLPVINDGKASKQVEEQIRNSVNYIKKNHNNLVEKAGKDGGGLYLRPEEYGFGDKTETPDGGHFYPACHIQINVTDDEAYMYLLPKHPSLALGKGTFKTVRYALDATSHYLVAAGSIDHLKAGGFNKIKKELDVQKRYDVVVHHTKFARDRSFWTQNKEKTIMPLANHGDLKKTMINAKGDPKKWTDKMENAAIEGSIVWIMQMHEDGIVNADFKPENVLVNIDNDGEIQISINDFGLSWKVGDKKANKLAGTPLYMAPEIVNKELDKIGKPVDIYALGLTLWQLRKDVILTRGGEMLNGPDYLKNSLKKGDKKVNTTMYQKNWESYEADDDFDQLIKDMMHYDPTKRPEIDEVKKRWDEIS
jgi:hypothetical protein